ncbi:MAG: serine hydrolase domain-containing protein, partial [Nostoc sp.]
MTKNQIPGLSVAVVQEGEPVLVKGYGLANVEHSVPATEHTVYEIASVGKTFTATVTMMLVEQGIISL